MLTRRKLLIAAALGLGVSIPAIAARRVRMFELYDDNNDFSPIAKELNGQRVAMQGFMAPHLKVGAAVRYRPRDVEEWLRAQEREAASSAR